MEFWLSFLPLIIYILLIILLVFGIVLAVKTIITMNKVEKVIDDVNQKVATLNPIFNIIDFTTDKIASFTDRAVDAASNIFGKLFLKRKKKEEDEDE